MMPIKPGYIGVLDIGGSLLRCNDFNVNLKQDALFYDHIIGLRDNIPSGIFGGKGDVGSLNIQKSIWRPGVKLVRGGFQYPLATEDPLYELAKTGGSFNMNFSYSCGIGRQFSDCKVNSYTFTITAGDYAIVNADVMGRFMEETGSDTLYEGETKLVTWDDFTISSVAGGGEIQSFTFTVNNNCSPIYTSGSNAEGVNDLAPLQIRVGMQELSGTISYYNAGSDIPAIANDPSTITISSGAFSAELSVIFQPQERVGAIGPVVSPLNFVGVNYALGE